MSDGLPPESDWLPPEKADPEKSTGRFEPGEIIANRYEVEKVLGQGGMGIVYLVWDRRTEQRLALKTLLPQYVSNSAAVHRFSREVKTVRQIDHPGVVKIYDAWKLGDLLLYTMEYVEGKSLRRLLGKRGRFGFGSTVRIMCLLCHALEQAHRVAIHRDLSPDNVMITKEGNVKLLDFGLAKLNEPGVQFTRIGVSLGKLQYMAPEQRENAAHVDHRADVYSLGVMLFELMAGQVPRPGEKLSDLIPSAPKACDDLIAQTMAKDVEERVQTAQEFRIRLMEIYEAYQQSKTDTGPPRIAPPEEKPGFVARILAVLGRLNPFRK
ncbi:MAG: serine/threonine protein kinase [Candidatus Hydrogenedentes bacterium]|nr:serine/threonine protein kinase [Candidatus Hydrogenedentota bacterium]